jgi:uncharacterized membrane protein YhaH (DUF805 family)
MLRCSCGHTNPDGGRFCEECGQGLVPQPNVCKACGSPCAPDARFCPSCGVVLNSCPEAPRVADKATVSGGTGMNFAQAINSGFSKYAKFDGRACRSEYWYWAIFSVVVSLVGSFIDAKLDTNIVSLILGLGLLLPNIAINSRRLHDIDRTGWWQLLVFTIIGTLLLLYWDLVRGTPGPNRFGADPLGPGRVAR